MTSSATPITTITGKTTFGKDLPLEGVGRCPATSIHLVAAKRSSRQLAADFGEWHHTYSGKRLVPARLSGWKGGEDAHSDTALRPADARAD